MSRIYICPICKEDIQDMQRKFIASDRPFRLNFYIHTKCLETVDIDQFVTENGEVLYNKEELIVRKGRNNAQ